MSISCISLVVACLCLIQFTSVSCQNDTFVYYSCSSDNNTSSGAYRKNVNTLLHSLSLKNYMDFGFYNVSEGQGEDKVNAIALCRGDLLEATCLRCLRFSTTNLLMRCPSSKEAIIWYENCMLRYSNRSIFHSVERAAFFMWKIANATEPHWFRQVLLVSFYSNVYRASLGDSRKKFDAADTFIDQNTKIYSLAQCTPDLNATQCVNCLRDSLTSLPSLVSQKLGGLVLGPSCSFRYELYQFYEVQHLAPSAPTGVVPPAPTGVVPPAPIGVILPAPAPTGVVPPAPTGVVPPAPIGVILPAPAGNPIRQITRRRILNRNIILASTLGILTLLFTCICTLILLKRRKTKLQSKAHQLFRSTDAHDVKSLESLQFDFETLKVATNNFSRDNKLGQGGFGYVYKVAVYRDHSPMIMICNFRATHFCDWFVFWVQGKLVEGKEIAVKRLATHSGQGDIEFTNEVVLLAKLQHRNLVRLLGYCLKGNERLVIYEFVSNSSLDHFLFDSVNRVCLDWEVRYRIINGIAKGLLYLHEDSRLRVVHRDLKAGNILLDEEMCPKIADFGMARLFALNQTQGDTIRIVGTYGYMAPEYAMHGKYSVKSDVYSYGILLLEIISGQKISRFSIQDTPYELTSFAWENWKAGTPSKIIDPTILKDHNGDMMRSIHIALLCVQDSLSDRPTMASVVFMLCNVSLALPVPSKPAIFASAELEMATTSRSRGEVGTSYVSQSSTSNDLPR